MSGNKTKFSVRRKMNKVREKTSMVVYLTLFIFVISCITSALLICTYLLLIKMNLMPELHIVWSVVILLFCSIAISTCLVRGLGNRILYRSLRQIITASKAVANGDFTQRLESPREKEVAEICDSFNEMVDKLGNNEMLARDFISNVSHQFKTPISSIHGYAQLLERDDLSDEERAEYIKIIKEKSIALSKLINDILELSRLEHLSTAIPKELFSVDEQLRKCVLSMEDMLSEKEIEIVLELQSVKYLGCRELLNEVWSNLLENAIKFTDKGGKITIILDCDFDRVKVIVRDNGIGMNSETKDRMYDRFYRGKEVHNRQGSGLGMAMVKSIIAKHGGSIAVKSELGKGSEFTVLLPLV